MTLVPTSFLRLESKKLCFFRFQHLSIQPGEQGCQGEFSFSALAPNSICNVALIHLTMPCCKGKIVLDCRRLARFITQPLRVALFVACKEDHKSPRAARDDGASYHCSPFSIFATPFGYSQAKAPQITILSEWPKNILRRTYQQPPQERIARLGYPELPIDLS